MSKIVCLDNKGNRQKINRKEFWAAFGEVAPPKRFKTKKFNKRFWKKVPEACAILSVRTTLAIAALSILVVCGLNPVRFLVSKFI